MQNQPIIDHSNINNIPMETEPLLLSHSSIPNSPSQYSNDVNIPSPLTSSMLKERMIYGPSPRESPSSSSVIAIDSALNQIQQEVPVRNGRRKCLHRSKTAPAICTIHDLEKMSSGTPAQLATPSIVRYSVGLLVLYLLLGVVIYWYNKESFIVSETYVVVDAMYFCIVTMCTIGYGDILPNSPVTKLFSIMFVLVGFGFIDILLSSMVSYVLDLQENYLLSSLSNGNGNGKKGYHQKYLIDFKKGRMRIRTKVGLALGVVVLCIGLGVGVMHFVEKLSWLDSFYLSVMSVTTVGYGDIGFTSAGGRAFACVWLLVSTLAVARAFLYLAEARVDKRHRRMVKLVLGQDLTFAQFLAADIDNNGSVSKAEYVIYKLKEMGKVTEKDILQICTIFDRLDTGNSGKISLTDLMQSRTEIR